MTDAKTAGLTKPAYRFLEPFHGRPTKVPPVWLMRQAGRYLPEYRKTRAEAGSFLDLCYNPKLAAEVTLQPIRRYGFDASILFSDILVVPDALGQKVRFVEKEGPQLDPITTEAGLSQLNLAGAEKTYATVCETVARLRQDLPKETALIGFCGAPWTVATYMVQGEGSKDQDAARSWAYRDPAGFQKLIDILVETSIQYLSGQVKAGANVLQIFDSWAGSLADIEFRKWVIAPTKRMVSTLKQKFPDVPVLGFPRGAGLMAQEFLVETGVDGISCDTAHPVSGMRALQASGKVVQGNLDPQLLVAGGPALDARIRELVAALGDKNYVFNLGHGIVPETPPEHVARLMDVLRGTAKS